MGFLQTIGAALGLNSKSLVKAPGEVQSASVSNRQQAGFWYGWGSSDRPRTDYEWEKLFGDNARLRNPIHAIAVDVAKVKKRVGRLAISDKGEAFTQIYGHAFESLLRNPHPRLPWSKWCYVVVGFLRLLGRAPVRVTFDERGSRYGAPVRLTPFAPHQVLHPPHRDKPYWDINWWGEVIQLPQGEVLDLYCPDLIDPFQALGMARALGDEANIDEAMQKFLNYYFRNMAFLGAIVNAPGCDPEEMAKEWSREREGVLNAFKTLFLNSQGVTVSNLSPTMKDLAFDGGFRLNRDLMGQGYQVPPERLGILENANRSTIDAADFFQQSGNVEPDVIYLEEAFNYYLAPLWGEPGLCVRFDNPVRETAEARLKQAQIGCPGPWLTINEARELHDRIPLPGGDVLAVEANNIVLIDAHGDLTVPSQPGSVEEQVKRVKALAHELSTNEATADLWTQAKHGGPSEATQLLTALLGATRQEG